jgi:hypothetical protein
MVAKRVRTIAAWADTTVVADSPRVSY